MDWDLIRTIAVATVVCVGGIIGGGWIVRLLVQRQFDYWDEQIKYNATAVSEIRREMRVEFAGLISKIDVVEGKLEEEDKRIHARVNAINETLPREYARAAAVDDIRKDLRHINHTLQQINRSLNGK